MTTIQSGYVLDFDDDFNGIILDDRQRKISVPGAIPGETIQYHVEHYSMHEPKGWGKCDALIKPSNHRIPHTKCPICWPTAGMCPGCPLMHIDDATQADLKRKFVKRTLLNAGITYIDNFTFTPAKQVFHYRNRTDLVAASVKGKFILGAYKPRSHDIVETKTCVILRPPLNQVVSFVVSVARSMRIFAAKPGLTFDDGALRYVSLFANTDGKVLIDLVATSAHGNPPSWIKPFAEQLFSFSPVAGVSFSLNDSPNNAIRIAPSTTLFGKHTLPEKHGDILSQFAASGFTQLNTQMAAIIYQKAASWLDRKPRVVWDLFCGVGAFGRTLAPSKDLYGAEFSPSAIQAAIQCAQNDSCTSHFEVMNLEKQWPSNWASPDVICLDPPRKGLNPFLIDKLLQYGPPTLIYMSCNPVSFARDTALLHAKYTIDKFEAFDMMPQTKQIETLALLKRF